MKETEHENQGKATSSGGQIDPWRGFKIGRWQKEIEVQNFIQKNYTPCEGDGARGGAVDLFRVSRCRKGAERCSRVLWPYLDLF